ncbi:MAG: hypothetical protein JXQ93_09545 [Flavobacteriaceae bacterium]
MMNKKRYLLLLLLPLLLSFTTHKYYLSLTQIEYQKEKQSVQIILNVFIDDIETALNEIHSIDLQLSTEKELKNNDTYFKKYLQNNLSIKIDDGLKEIIYIGKEYEGDNVFFYLEIEGIKSIKNLEIENSILVQHFPKQQNLIKARINNVNRSKLLSKKNGKALLKF